jgi:glutathione S-transferase
MAHYRLHCCGGSGNSYKLALYLSCAGLNWEPVGVDFAGGETRNADWRAASNMMGEVPVLEVAGKRMSQSGAILLWLAVAPLLRLKDEIGHRIVRALQRDR